MAMTPDAGEPEIRRASAPLIAIAGVVMLFAANFAYPVLRTTSPAVNAAVTVVVLLLPWVAVGLSFRLRTRTQRFTVAALWSVVALLLAPLALLKSFEVRELRAAHDVDGGFQPVSVAEFDGSRVIAYQTNGGATTDYGFVVRHERPLGAGLLLVRELCSEYRAMGGRVERVDDHTVRAFAESKVTPVGDFTVRRFVWF